MNVSENNFMGLHVPQMYVYIDTDHVQTTFHWSSYGLTNYNRIILLCVFSVFIFHVPAPVLNVTQQSPQIQLK